MNKKPYVIFYGTGGGARALLPLRVLAHIREKRQSHFINGIDCFAGPSTAAIYMSGFNTPDPKNPTEPLWSEQDMVDNYQKTLPEIFHLHHKRRHLSGMFHDKILPKSVASSNASKRFITSAHKYNQAILEAYLKDLNTGRKFSDGLKSQLVGAHSFSGKNIRFKDIKEAPHHNFEANMAAHKIATASSAHPICFPSYPMELECGKYNFIDGGFFEHPLHVYLEMRRILPEEYEIHMVYMSTGNEPSHGCSSEEFDRLGITGYFDLKNKMPLSTQFTAAQFKENMNTLRAELGDRLHEFDFNLEDYFPKNEIPLMDDIQPSTLEKYEESSKRLIIAKAESIRDISDLLTARQTFEIYEQSNVSEFTDAVKNTSQPSSANWYDRFASFMPLAFRKTAIQPKNNTFH